MSTTTALTVVPRTVDEFNDLAERFAKSSLLPKSMQGKSPDVLVTIMAGAEMGLSPMASLRAIHLIEGKPVLSADSMVALALGSGKCVYFRRVAESDKAVTYETLRTGEQEPRRCTWTIEQAKTAGVHLKDNWRAYPRSMLAARAKAELARDVYPDVLMGCYTEDEIERPAFVAQPFTPEVVDAEVIESVDLSEIAAAESIDALKALAPKFANLDPANKATAKEAYDAKMRSLKSAAKNGAHTEQTA